MNNVLFKNLENGLTLCLIKKRGYVQKEAMLAFKCGSINTQFLTPGGKCRVPFGTAHFVEHKLFEKKHGNAFDDFSALGANVNAFTSLDTTAYYFTCCDNFYKCLSLLGEMSANPYFTDKNVKKELGIIGSEITMYEDNPSWQAHFSMLKGLYDKHPVSYSIAGSKEDIEQITPKALQIFYNSYYTGGNAILIAAGDINEYEFFSEAEKAFPLKKSENIKSLFPKSEKIERVSVKKHMPIATPVFSIGFKENGFDMSPVMRILTSKILLNILAGKGSVLYEKLYTSGLCNNPLNIDYICGKDYGVSVLSGTSQNPERLLSMLHCEITNFLNYGIAENYLNRIIKKCKGSLIQSYDSLDFCCSFTADNFIKSVKTLDIFDKYDSINSDELIMRLKNHFRADNLCMSQIMPL